MDAVHKSLSLLRPLAYKVPEAAFILATWVDNLYTMGKTVYAATKMLDIIEKRLRDDWNLWFKESSKMSMPPRGG